MDSEDLCVNPRATPDNAFEGILTRLMSRRATVLGAVASGAALSFGGCATSAQPGSRSVFRFDEIARRSAPDMEVAPDHAARVLIRWGDPLFADAPAFSPLAQTPAAQERQFGFNNDYVAFFPLPGDARRRRALLCVNHEFTSAIHMFPGIAGGYPDRMTAELCAVEKAAHGVSVVEIEDEGRGWAVVTRSRLNRRITAQTPMTFSGPAAGSPRLRTRADPDGVRPLGTLNNCAGGKTPWGTYLTAEENFNYYFGGVLDQDHAEAANHRRCGVPNARYAWWRFDDRFDVAREPNEANRFGWIVEIDPNAPTATPIKRTALGRFKHEGAETVVAPDGRLVVYMGDDQRFEYLYKYVSRGRVDPNHPGANAGLLDDGTLHVARFDDEGGVVWLPLVFGQGALTPANGFASQADVLIETRRAADLLGATPMDRPEDVEPDPRRGAAYVMLTNNTQRTPERVDAANPRANNRFGHIIEILEPNGDFAATSSRWAMLVRCGDPASPEIGAQWHEGTSVNGWFAAPDNGVLDPAGRLWVTTDGNDASGSVDDGVWGLVTDGAQRGMARAFFRAPVGAEVCGPAFTPEGDTMFIPVQHPGEVDGSNFEAPATRWPDFDPAAPPRPAVVVVTRERGGRVVG